MKNKELILDLLKEHWSEKVTQSLEIIAWLMEKDLSELEYLHKCFCEQPRLIEDNPKIRNIIKLIMELKVKSL